MALAPAAAIRVLPPDLVAKIAAGEVVERPASVVKELVENALDAGAHAIRVEIQRGGLGLIRVTDDGCGIAPDQLALAVCRHATSKLAQLDDLFRVQTLGFRGEALASIAAVAHLEIASRAAGEAAGRAIRVEGGRVVHQAPAGGPTGTTGTVRQLFFNVPARQAFQRSPAGEARQIASLCSQLALAAPHVRLHLEVDGHRALQAPGTGDPSTGSGQAPSTGSERALSAAKGQALREALAAAYGPAVAGRMLPLPELEEDGARVWGYCSGPEEHRNTRLYCTFCVNGRVVRSATLTYAVEEAYHALLPGGRHPLAAIHLAVPPDEVDVNVHPTKLEIRLRRERLAFSLVRTAVRQALAEFAPVPDLQPATIGGQASALWDRGPGTDAGLDSPRNGGGTAWPASDLGAAGAAGGAPPAWPGGALASASETGENACADRPGGPSRPELVRAAQPPPGAPAGGRAPATRSGLRALGQVGLTYIVAEDASGLYLIDQHSAHERVMYEQLLRQAHEAQAGDGAPPAQLLLAPELVDLNGAQAAWLRDNAAALQAFGFQVEHFGGQTWLLRAVPRAMAARARGRALAELIDGLIEREYGDGPLLDQARWAVACHSAVRAGDALAPEEMAALLAQLERCDMRRTCPHGRPTMIHLSHAQLEREFGRR